MRHRSRMHQDVSSESRQTTSSRATSIKHLQQQHHHYYYHSYYQLIPILLTISSCLFVDFNSCQIISQPPAVQSRDYFRPIIQPLVRDHYHTHAPMQTRDSIRHHHHQPHSNVRHERQAFRLAQLAAAAATAAAVATSSARGPMRQEMYPRKSHHQQSLSSSYPGQRLSQHFVVQHQTTANNNNNKGLRSVPAERRASTGASSGSKQQQNLLDGEPGGGDDDKKLLICYYTTKQSAPYWPKDSREFIMPINHHHHKQARMPTRQQANNEHSAPFLPSSQQEMAQLLIKSPAQAAQERAQQLFAGGQMVLISPSPTFTGGHHQHEDILPAKSKSTSAPAASILGSQPLDSRQDDLVVIQQKLVTGHAGGLVSDANNGKAQHQQRLVELADNGVIVGASSAPASVQQQQQQQQRQQHYPTQIPHKHGSMIMPGQSSDNKNNGANSNNDYQDHPDSQAVLVLGRAAPPPASPAYALAAEQDDNNNNQVSHSKSQQQQLMFAPIQQHLQMSTLQQKVHHHQQTSAASTIQQQVTHPSSFMTLSSLSSHRAKSLNQPMEQGEQEHNSLSHQQQFTMMPASAGSVAVLDRLVMANSPTSSSSSSSSATAVSLSPSLASPSSGTEQTKYPAPSSSTLGVDSLASNTPISGHTSPTMSPSIKTTAQQSSSASSAERLRDDERRLIVNDRDITPSASPIAPSPSSSTNPAAPMPSTASSGSSTAAANSASPSNSYAVLDRDITSDGARQLQLPQMAQQYQSSQGNSLSSALVSSPLATMFDVFGAASQYLMRFKPSSFMSPSSISSSLNNLVGDHNHHHVRFNNNYSQHHVHSKNSSGGGGAGGSSFLANSFITLPFSGASILSGSIQKPGVITGSNERSSGSSSASGSSNLSSKSSNSDTSSFFSRLTMQNNNRREEICGRTIQTPERRIIGGEGARYGEFPYQVHIKIAKHQCGGALVDKQSIVTAAHCVYHFITRAPVSKLQIVIGAYDIEDEQYQELPPQYFKVNKVKLHPNFRFSASHPDRYDVAILKLDKPVKYTDNVLPVCLPSKDLKLESKVGTVTGFGKTDPSLSNRYGTRLLQKVDVPIIENSECERWHRTRGIDLKIFPEMMCAGYEDGLKDACVGDSGGPLVIKTPVGNNGSFRWTLAGITSAGFGCAQSRQPGIYHRVSHTVDWILENLD